MNRTNRSSFTTEYIIPTERLLTFSDTDPFEQLINLDIKLCILNYETSYEIFSFRS
jgi:hypothetical protein